LLLTAALTFSAPNAFAQNDLGGILRFEEAPGVMEFSGQLTARPLQMDALLEQGYSPDAAQAAREHAAGLVDEGLIEYVEATDEYVFTLAVDSDENSQINELMNSGLFEYVEPNWLCYPSRTPNDPKFGQQWHHNKMNSKDAWDYTTGDANFIAGWVDTGVDLQHEDLKDHLLSGYNSVNRKTQANGGDVSDINGHGTNTGGCIGAVGDNGKGLAGINWTVKLLPVRCSNSSGGSAYLNDITDGLRWCVDNGAKTASASYGGVNSSSAGTTGNYIKGQGGLCFWSSGNEYTQINGYDHAGVIIVGSSGQSDTKSGFSNYGAFVDVVAPGEGIWTTKNSSSNNSYSSVSGTSFSCPLTNGVCALMWAANPSLTNDEVEQMLFDTCKDIESAGEDNKTGHGRVDAGAAVAMASGGVTDFTLIVPNSLTAGTSLTLIAEGVAPGTAVSFYYSLRGTGATWVGSLGIFLEMKNAVFSGSASADAAGQATYSRVIPTRGAGRDVWIQAAMVGDITQVEQRYIN
jgi:subtilisin family serine protease